MDVKLEQIGRKYVHRHTTGYKSFCEVMDDMMPVIGQLSPTQAASEYWLRVANDIDGYLAEWHEELDQEDAESVLTGVGLLEKRIMENMAIFTGTQRVRLLSTASRSRARFAAITPAQDWKDIWRELIESRGDNQASSGEEL